MHNKRHRVSRKIGCLFRKSLKLVQNVKNKLNKKGRDIESAKLSKNPGLSQIKTISGNISGEISSDNESYRCVT